MANIEIKLELDSNNPSDLQAFTNLLAAFGGTSTAVMQIPANLGKVAAPIQNDTAPVAEASSPKVTTTEIREYSEEELKAMDNATLKDVATGLQIDWANEEGKNTNAKLIKLILKNYEGSEQTENKEETTEQDQSNASESTATESKAEATQDAPAETTGSVTLNELKVELGKKVDDNREAIVAELGKLGASKLSNLKEEHYTHMYKFLTSL